ncbi:hypothetical protein Y032_0018g3620 [Ancylostoma ceylanicum]|uniref:Uncharacterized protein n=1 Tax=Ancylostoma ceylanicum TaxID=53326 RepID=A0A016V3V8_9BILA|nr:hypothetical protein Y032_0018g3620 [Ancylostoma ceylanicum]
MISLRSIVVVVFFISFIIGVVDAFYLGSDDRDPFQKRFYNGQNMAEYIDAIRRGALSGGMPSYMSYLDVNRRGSAAV